MPACRAQTGSARLVVGMPVGAREQVPRGGTVLRKGDPTPGQVKWAHRVTTLGLVSGQRVPGGVVHRLPADLRKALIANATALDAWKDITPLACANPV